MAPLASLVASVVVAIQFVFAISESIMALLSPPIAAVALACAGKAAVFAEFDCKELRLSAIAPRIAAKTRAAIIELPRLKRGDELMPP